MELAPPDFRVVAILTAYNEADIIVPSIQHLVSQGMGVYVIDNWSTDETYDLALQFQGRGLVGIERFPKDGPPLTCKWRDLLDRKEELAQEIRTDWLVHHDVDEVRRSPWPGVTLRDAIYRVDRAGFNCIDHTVLEFCPTDNGYPPGSDFEAYFAYYSLEVSEGTYPRLNAWKNLGQPVSLAARGGHDVQFGGKRVFPYKFLLKHYPVRSQAHGVRKVFHERKARWEPKEMAGGWHTHYDHISEGHCFLRNPSDLLTFEEETFNKTFLVERIASITQPESHHLSALLRQFEGDRDHMRVLLRQAEEERNNLRTQAQHAEEERDRLQVALRRTEEERDALLAHLRAVANGRMMRLLNLLARPLRKERSRRFDRRRQLEMLIENDPAYE